MEIAQLPRQALTITVGVHSSPSMPGSHRISSRAAAWVPARSHSPGLRSETVSPGLAARLTVAAGIRVISFILS